MLFAYSTKKKKVTAEGLDILNVFCLYVAARESTFLLPAVSSVWEPVTPEWDTITLKTERD